MAPVRSQAQWLVRAGSSIVVLAAALGVGACGGESGSGGGGVTPPPAPVVRSVTVTPSTTTVRVGDSQTLSALVDASAGAATTVTWSSEAPSVATVSPTGVVTGVGGGTATIRAASTVNSAVSGIALIVVQPTRTLAVSPSLINIGTNQTAQLTATVQIEPALSTAVQWRTANPAVATVSATGLVSGVALGSTQITAVSQGDTTLRASTTVNVTQVVRAVAVTPAAATLNINNAQQLTATVTADAGLATTITWRSASPAVATVNGSGLVTAVGVGTANILAISTADTTRRATSVITVAPRTTTVRISERTVAVNPGTGTSLTTTIVADPGVNTTLDWTSSAPQVASVSASGAVTGLSVGTTLITAAVRADPTRRDTLTVRVVPRLGATWTASRLTGALYEDVVSIVAPDAGSSFAVNSVGNIYRWNGTAWALSAAGSAFNTTFYAVHASSGSNVIAVGANGVIARFNGTSWSAMSSGTTRALYSVWVENGTTAWAAGANGTVLRLATSTWSAENAGTTRALNAIWSGDNVVVAAGADGTVLRRVGSSWSLASVPTTEDLFGVHGVSATDVVAVGNSGTILRFNGTAWSLVPPSGVTGSFYAIGGAPADAGRRFLAGDAGVSRLDGTTLTAVSTPYAPRMYGVTLDAAGTVWAAGQRGAVLRSGAPWTTNNLAPDLLDVWSVSPTVSYAVGEFGFVYRWTNGAWTRLVTPTTAHLNTVWAPTATDAFVGGVDGTMLRWNGTTWTTMTVPTTASITAIWGAAANNVFATTRAGEILRFNGTTWSLAQSHGSPLWSVFGASATDVMVSGENGSVLRLSGTTWTALPVPAGSGTLAGLWLTGATNVLTVGATVSGSNGAAYRFDGANWSGLQVGSPRVLTSLWGPSVNDLFVTGADGLLLRFNGSTWSPIATETTDLLWGLTASPDATGAAFAVGQNGTVVAGTNGAGFAAAALRTDGAPSLEPGTARWRRSPAPSGDARRRRR